MDVLTDVLETVRLQGLLFGRLELTAPWGVSVRAMEHVTFHVVMRGRCWLEVEGEAPVLLESGDLFVLPRGHAHVLRDDPSTPPRPLEEVMGGSCSEKRPGEVRHHGGGGAPATLVCGCFQFEDRRQNPVLEVLPPLIHIKGEKGRAVPWLDTTLQFIACEAASGRPGGQTVIRRLADVLFIQTVRAYLATFSDGVAAQTPGAGWLRALSDPQIGAALGRIHRQPEVSWTVAGLASEVGMSRSAFSARFTLLVGEPPLAYVTRWRMYRAANLLRTGRANLAEIAGRVGYESEAAFSKAFKRSLGTAPGAYRQASRATTSPSN